MDKIRLTAEQIYDRLLHVDNIKEVEGQIRFFLGDVDIIVRQKDVVGNIIQEWLEGWLKKNNIAFDTNPNTQMPPDIFLNPENHTEDLLEVKAFNFSATPGFDIADFKAYAREIIAPFTPALAAREGGDGLESLGRLHRVVRQCQV